jgi:hypothetical protein
MMPFVTPTVQVQPSSQMSMVMGGTWSTDSSLLRGIPGLDAAAGLDNHIRSNYASHRAWVAGPTGMDMDTLLSTVSKSLISDII